MKSRFTLLMFMLTVVLLTACSFGMDHSNEVKEKKPTNHDQEVKSITAEIEHYSFDEALNEVDLIAEVKINTVVKEIDDPSEKTIFEVEVLNVLLGKNDQENIKVLQQGTEEVSYNDIDLFKAEEKYVLFLRKTIDFPDADYWIQGEEEGIYKVVENELVKISRPYEELETIEIVEMKNEKSTNQQANSGIQQILDKDAFFELIKDAASDSKVD